MSGKDVNDKLNNAELEEINDAELDEVTGGSSLNPPRMPVDDYDKGIKDRV
jgi:bacteriocin-like protein